MDRVTKTHVYFWGDITFSNWGESKFEHDGEQFKNAEQAFMWEKAMCFDDLKIAQRILENDNPSYVKKLGRQVKNYNEFEWAKKRYDVMLDVNMAKFRQNPKLKEILLSTGDRTIVEASPYDKIWGVGLHWNDDNILDESNWNGCNMLGQVLMEVRETLR